MSFQKKRKKKFLVYRYLIGKEVKELESFIDGKKVIIELSKDKQLKKFNKEIVVRVRYNDKNIFILTALFDF